jgi:hypothetical protein
MVKSPDPTKDPKFQAVVQHFLKTPHKPHSQSKAKPKTSPKKREEKKEK